MRFLFSLFLILSLPACQTTYYSVMEKVGIHKREIMADRVEKASIAQEKAGEQFQSALEALMSLTNFSGGELEKAYNTINSQYEKSVDAVKKVKDSIESIENVSNALFDEWQKELDLYTNATLRRESEQKLSETQRSYQQMLTAMKQAENKMYPVLDTLRDNTLYLKHNLNAAAINALQGEFSDLEKEINVAIEDMQVAIAESQRFLSGLQ